MKVANVQQNGDRNFSLDRALVEAAAALLEEIHSEPVSQSIIDLADQLQAVLDKKPSTITADVVCTIKG